MIFLKRFVNYIISKHARSLNNEYFIINNQTQCLISKYISYDSFEKKTHHIKQYVEYKDWSGMPPYITEYCSHYGDKYNYEYELTIKSKRPNYIIDDKTVYKLVYNTHLLYKDCGHVCKNCPIECKQAKKCTTIVHCVTLMSLKTVIKIIHIVNQSNYSELLVKQCMQYYTDGKTYLPTKIYYNSVKKANILT